jgi:hypothetical protein
VWGSLRLDSLSNTIVPGELEQRPVAVPSMIHGSALVVRHATSSTSPALATGATSGWRCATRPFIRSASGAFISRLVASLLTRPVARHSAAVEWCSM